MMRTFKPHLEILPPEQRALWRVSLAQGLAAARLLFGPNFQPSESLKALVYYEDGDLHTLTPVEKHTLIHAAKAVRELPEVRLAATNLCSPHAATE